jgi:hypothetical protein
MKLLAFQVESNSDESPVQCGEDTAISFAEDLGPWARMRGEIEETAPSVNNYTERQWQERFASGHAAIVVVGRRIVAHISLVDPTQFSRHRRATAYVGQAWPWFGVWESTSGWTHPDTRRKGLQRFLRTRLYERAPRQDLLVSFCIGTAASPVLSELGWVVAPWSQFLVVSELIGHVDSGGVRLYQGVYRNFGGRDLYQGRGRYPDATPSHDWDAYVHFWVRDAAQALECEAAFRNADWRRAVAVSGSEQEAI